MPKIKRTYYLTETGEPLGSVEGEYPSFLAEEILAAFEESAKISAKGRPYHYVDGKAMSCAELERWERREVSGE